MHRTSHHLPPLFSACTYSNTQHLHSSSTALTSFRFPHSQIQTHSSTALRFNSTMSKPVVKRDSISDGDPITVPSLSASVIILAPLRTRTPDGFDYRILLLQRHGKSSTFNSAHVYPGGNIDAGDSMKEWDALYPDWGSESKESRAIKLCAVRETFEESGILLCECTSPGGAKAKWEGVSEAERKVWRDKVHSNGSAFIDLFKFLRGSDGVSSLRPALSSLQYRANWVTPRNMKRRFDTHFFMTVLPPTFQLDSSSSSNGDAVISQLIGSSDGKETVSSDWLTPLEAVRLTLAGSNPDFDSSATVTPGILQKITLFPPQFYMLAELMKTKSYQDLLDPADCNAEGAAKVKGRKVMKMEPEMKAVEDLSGAVRAATVLPGDPAHSATSRMYPNATKDVRHRTYVLLPAKPSKDDEKWKAKAPLGLTVLGLHRSGMSELDGVGAGWEDMVEGNFGKKPVESKL